MKNNKLSVALQIRGKQGIFNSTKDITLFHEHITQVELKNVLKAIKSELKKDMKYGEVAFDVLSMDTNYNRKDKLRLFVRTGWNAPTIDMRIFNGIDFGDSVVYNFASDNDMIKFLIKTLDNQIVAIMDDIPVEKGRYAAKLDEKYDNERELV
jgi:hypothetical protein